jgi:hypothetical protein
MPGGWGVRALTRVEPDGLMFLVRFRGTGDLGGEGGIDFLRKCVMGLSVV